MENVFTADRGRDVVFNPFLMMGIWSEEDAIDMSPCRFGLSILPLRSVTSSCAKTDGCNLAVGQHNNEQPDTFVHSKDGGPGGQEDPGL